jgi:hypothetical protein
MAYRIAIVLVFVTTHAFADPSDFYLEMPLSLSSRVAKAGDPDGALGGGLLIGLGAGMRWRGDWALRGELRAGPSVGDITRGSMYEARVGIERRIHPHASGVYYGIDLAATHEDVLDDPDESTLTAAMAIPRAGLVVGGSHVQFRLGLGIALGFGRVHDRAPDITGYADRVSYGFAGGIDFDLGVTFGD